MSSRARLPLALVASAYLALSGALGAYRGYRWGATHAGKPGVAPGASHARASALGWAALYAHPLLNPALMAREAWRATAPPGRGGGSAADDAPFAALAAADAEARARRRRRLDDDAAPA